ncbi:MAG TPA: histidine kinase [Gaiellaceae bacterium]
MRLALLHEGRALDTVVVALAVLGQIEVWADSAAEPRLLAAAGSLLATLPLLLRRRFPFAAPVFIFVAVAVLTVARSEAVRDGAGVTLFALVLAFWIVGARNERNQALAAAAVGFAAVAVLADRAAAPEVRANPPFPGGAVQMGSFEVEVLFLVPIVAALALGAYVLRARERRASVLEERTARLERDREEEARAAVAAERRRIARDLHELIVHGVSVMTVQAGAARVLLDEEPGRAREPLLAIEEAGRQTLAETRRLLGMLRTDDDEATLAPVPELAELALPEPVETAVAPEERGEVDGAGTLLRRYAFDVLIVLVAVVSEIEIFVISVPGPTAVLIPAVLLWTLPLLWRRRFPLAAPACVFAVLTASAFFGDAVGGDVTSAVPLFLAFWVVGYDNDRNQLLAGLALGFASLVVIADQDVRLETGDTVSAIVTSGAVALVAYVLRRRARRATAFEERAARLEREREEQARAAVAAERRRIARDLHDVIAHSISVMTVQAGAARLVLAEEPERAREPLLAVEQTGRQSLAEMRRLVGFLRPHETDAAPAARASLAALTDLLGQVRTAGLPVELAVDGEQRELPPGIELAAYRIVQEALTNARKHGSPTRATVALHYGPGALEIEVANDIRGRTTRNGTGHGLVGMRERVALYRGELEAGPREGRGFVVRARLPVEPVLS